VRVPAVALVLLTMLIPAAHASSQDEPLLQAREKVWRAWFANDQATLRALVPEGTWVISAGEPKWKGRAGVLQSAEEFHAAKGRLLRLEFPRTEIQHFGRVAIVYSQYSLELESDGKRTQSAGRVTEVFVQQHGRWVNPGWHTDAEH